MSIKPKLSNLLFALLITMNGAVFLFAETTSTAAEIYRNHDKALKLEANNKLVGLAVYEAIGKNNLDGAEKMLRADLTDNAAPTINHWWLARISLARKKFSDFHKHLVLAKSLPLLKNTRLAHEFYLEAPASQRAWLVGQITNAGYFDAPPISSCPYFELNQRKKRADFLFLLAKNHRLNKNIKNKIFRELYIVMPETIDVAELGTLNGFDRFAKAVSVSDLVKRMEQLLVFGKNSEARATYDAKVAVKKPALTKDESCELEYVDAKVDRKIRKYDAARTRFREIATTCPKDLQLKARYLNLMLAAQRGDETALPEFSAFIESYPDHSFSDDVLLFKANLLLDKNQQENALATLNQIIVQFPQGDMIERALFLKGFLLAKQGKIDLARESMHALLAKTAAGEHEHAQAQNWIDRLSVFGDLARLDNPNKAHLAVAKKSLLELVHAPNPTVYSWLSYGLLTHLGEKITLNNQQTTAALGSVETNITPKAADLDRIENLVARGFRNEAVALLEDITIDKDNKDYGVRVATLYDVMNLPASGHQKLIRCDTAVAQNLKQEAPSIYQKISYPRPFAHEVSLAVNKIDVPADIIFAIMRQESGFIPESVSWAGAKGLMQLMYTSALGQANVWGIKNLEERDLYAPEINVLLATSLLQSYWQQFGSIVVGLAAYNAGPSMAKAWVNKNKGGSLDTFIEDISFKETRDYVKSVLGNIFAYVIFNVDKNSVGTSFKQMASIK